MKMPGLKVFAPATIGNLAVGFDILGLAIDGPGDEIVIKPTSESGVSISSITGDGGKLPRDARNTALFAAREVLKASGMSTGAELDIIKKMPFGSGMGSSAASAVAGALAMNEFLDRPFKREELLPFSIAGEQQADGALHADNVAPSLLGGIVLIRSLSPIEVVRLPVPRGLMVLLVHPQIQILTKESRAALSDQISLNAHVVQSAHLASFVSALYKSDFDLLSRSLNDFIVEPQRAKLIPRFYDMKQAAMDLGALGFSISGAGPSVFALCNNSLVAEKISERLIAILAEEKIEARSYISAVNQEGAFKY